MNTNNFDNYVQFLQKGKILDNITEIVKKARVEKRRELTEGKLSNQPRKSTRINRKKAQEKMRKGEIPTDNSPYKGMHRKDERNTLIKRAEELGIENPDNMPLKDLKTVVAVAENPTAFAVSQVKNSPQKSTAASAASAVTETPPNPSTMAPTEQVVPVYATVGTLSFERPKVPNSSELVLSTPANREKINAARAAKAERVKQNSSLVKYSPDAVLPHGSFLSRQAPTFLNPKKPSFFKRIPDNVKDKIVDIGFGTGIAAGLGGIGYLGYDIYKSNQLAQEESPEGYAENYPETTARDSVSIEPDSVHIVPVDSVPLPVTDSVVVAAPAIGSMPDSVVVQPVQPQSVSAPTQVSAKVVQPQQETKPVQTKPSKRRPIQRNQQPEDVSYNVDSLVGSNVVLQEVPEYSQEVLQSIPAQSDQTVVISNTPTEVVSIPVVESSNVYNTIPEATIRQIEDSVQRNIVNKKPVVLVKKNRSVPINLQDYNGYVDIPTEVSDYTEPIPAETAYNVRTDYVEDQRLRKEYLKQEIANIARALNEQL